MTTGVAQSDWREPVEELSFEREGRWGFQGRASGGNLQSLNRPPSLSNRAVEVASKRNFQIKKSTKALL